MTQDKPRVLVLYFTQSGQLKDILDSVLSDTRFATDTIVDWVAITPEKPFPFPWTPDVFFDTMPETVEHLPSPIKPLPKHLFQNTYDLIVLGYQPWFLNPSQPITAFLQSDDARILKGNRVLTVIGSRNMWLHAQEKVKAYIQAQGATLVGNICLFDRHTNIISTLTVIRWTFTGQKEAGRWLPAAGVQDEDIKAASRFSTPLFDSLSTLQWDALHEQLLRNDAIILNPGLILLEQRAIKNFRFWSKYIREKGEAGNPARRPRVRLFKRLLIVGIFILSPISAISAFIKLQLHKKKLLKDVAYFKDVNYEAGRI